MNSFAEVFRYARHELNMAWRRLQLRRCYFRSGLGDSGWLLHGLVRAMKPETCVEIGSAHGYSTCLIALALQQNIKGRLWAFDPHQTNHWSDDDTANTLEQLKRNLHRVGVTHRVEIVRQTTIDAAALLPDNIDLAFIDGDHSYDGVKQDWNIIAPRMNEWGVVIFHDTLWDRNGQDPYYVQYRREQMGVPQLVEELRRDNYPIITINKDWGVTLVQSRRFGNSLAKPNQ
jgi:predicted O-methyltransferase YrrM